MDPARTPSDRPRGANDRLERLVVFGVVIVLFVLGTLLQVFDDFEHGLAMSPHLDEALLAGVLLLSAVALLSVRRGQRFRREHALREDAEARFRTMVERVPAVSYVWDSSRRPGSAPAVYISPQIESLLGYTSDAWLRSPDAWAAAVHPDDLGSVLEMWDEAVGGQRAFAAEYRIRRNDGTYIWVRDEASPDMSGEGGAPIYQGVMLDVSERRSAEEQLRQAEERWRLLLEHLPVTAYMIEFDEQEPRTVHDRWIGPGITSLTGYTADEWMGGGDSWERSLHPDDRDRVLGGWREATEHGGRFESEYRLVRKDGTSVWIHEESDAIVRDGRVRAEGVFIDVSARHEAESALKEAEARYRSLVEQLPVVVYTDAVDDLSTALYVSPRYEQLTGYPAERRMADPALWVNMLHPDDRDRVLAESERTNELGDPFDVEYRIVRADGSTAWLHDHAILVDGQNGRGVWQGILQDVTERHNAQQALAGRDAILQAAGLAAERFLRADSWRGALPEVIERLGDAGGAARAYVLENGSDDDGHEVGRVVHAWWQDEVEVAPEHPIRAPIRWSGAERWASTLREGSVLHARVPGLAPEEERLLEVLGARSILAVPVIVDGAWWGSIGFDRVDEARPWHEPEIEALTVTANTLAAAIERESAVTRLEETERRYQALVEQTPAVTYLYSFDETSPDQWTCGYVSPQVEDLFGIGADQWSGDRVAREELVHPADRLRAREAQTLHRTAGEPLDVEVRVLRPDGQVRWVRDQAIMIHDEHGRPRWSQGIVLDVTERRDAEEALRAAEERYRGIVEHVPAAIYLDRADTSMEPVYVSPQIQAITGATSEEWMAEPELWLKMMDPEDREAVQRSYLAAARAGEPWKAEYRMRTRDGRTIWVHDETTFLHDEGGERRYLQGVLMDITERKLAEQALRESERRERDAAERLRALDDMKNTFLAAVSHELRSPLTSILGLSLTLERTPYLDAQDRADLLDRLGANARKLDRLLRDLLDIDRLNRGIVEPQLRATDVGAIARRTVESLDHLTAREVTVSTEAVLMGVDPAKVERIVENLLTNAARHTASDRRIWLSVQPHGDGALIMVEDDGPGVPEELRDAIFEPFRQGPSAAPHSPGTGIGLSLVARFAELHGGRAWVEEREGGGSSFRVYIPSSDGPSSVAEEGGPDRPVAVEAAGA